MFGNTLHPSSLALGAALGITIASAVVSSCSADDDPSGSSSSSSTAGTGGSGGSGDGGTLLPPPDGGNFDAGSDPDSSLGCAPEGSYQADDGNICALHPVAYDRDGATLQLSVTAGARTQLTEPSLEIIYATELSGYEGFFILAKETSSDHYYFRIADDDFIELDLTEWFPGGQACGITPECGGACVPTKGGDVCRAFVDDFVPIVAARTVGSPATFGPISRMEAGGCTNCAQNPSGMCNASATTYSMTTVTGPSGTIDFIFEDGTAFLDHQGWTYTHLGQVTGTAQLQFDLCEDLPPPK